MPESPNARATRMLANTEAGVPQEILNDYPRWDVRLATLTESTQDYAVDYDWQFDHDDQEKLVLRRTVWTIAHRRKDQHIVWQGDIVTIHRSQAPRFVNDLVSCLSV